MFCFRDLCPSLLAHRRLVHIHLTWIPSTPSSLSFPAPGMRILRRVPRRSLSSMVTATTTTVCASSHEQSQKREGGVPVYYTFFVVSTRSVRGFAYCSSLPCSLLASHVPCTHLVPLPPSLWPSHHIPLQRYLLDSLEIIFRFSVHIPLFV